MKHNKVAVVFIGTDKYLNFLPEWYKRCEEKFLPDVKKQYGTNINLDIVLQQVSIAKVTNANAIHSGT